MLVRWGSSESESLVRPSSTPLNFTLQEAEREPQRLLALACLRRQPPAPAAVAAAAAAAVEEDGQGRDDETNKEEERARRVGRLAAEALPDDLFTELMDSMAPRWMG